MVKSSTDFSPTEVCSNLSKLGANEDTCAFMLKRYYEGGELLFSLNDNGEVTGVAAIRIENGNPIIEFLRHPDPEEGLQLLYTAVANYADTGYTKIYYDVSAGKIGTWSYLIDFGWYFAAYNSKRVRLCKRLR